MLIQKVVVLQRIDVMLMLIKNLNVGIVNQKEVVVEIMMNVVLVVAKGFYFGRSVCKDI